MSKHRADHSQSGDLFGELHPGPPRELSIAPQGAAPLGKAQLTFNRLVTQLKGLRDKLAEWAAFEFRHQQRVIAELVPAQRQLGAARRETILLIAGILSGGRGGVSGKTAMETLTAHLLELIEPHLADAPDDEEIIALHDRYAVLTFAEDQEFEREMTRELAQQMFGVELDDDELAGRSVEDIMAAGMAKARHAAEQKAAEASSRRARGKQGRDRAAEKAAATEQAAREVSQSVREVYRKLASALHPDRAKDEADRLRRHALMQRVNAAYDASDLLSLLTLQLEIEQIDAEHLAQVSGARLGHYNTVLREQVRELEQELTGIKRRFSMMLESPFANVTPASVESALRAEIAAIRRAVRELKEHRELLREPDTRKQWLKAYALTLRQARRTEKQLVDEMETLAVFGNGIGLDPFSSDTGFEPFVRGRQPSPARRRRLRRR